MADQEHLKMFLQGVPCWNKWRNENPDIQPDLSDAKLVGWNSSARKAWNSSMAINLQKANLWNADLSGACLIEADLRGAILLQAKLEKSCLMNANFENANLEHANVKSADFVNANLEGANVSGILYNRFTRYRGMRVATCYGSPRFRRFAQDQDFIEEFREESHYRRFLYYLWLISTDCGRSFWPLLLWMLLVCSLFGAVYADYEIPGWFSFMPQSLKDFLIAIDPQVNLLPSHTWFSPYYFSIVTLTTLGFGDITPSNLAGEIWVAIEVMLGYVILGLLVSILGNKIARRS